MSQTFEEEVDCRKVVLQHLPLSIFQRKDQELFISGVLTEFVEPGSSSVSTDRAGAIFSPGLKYVIRDDDLKIIDSVWAGLSAATGCMKLASAPVSTSLLVGTGAALFRLLRSVLTKGRRVNALQCQILITLKASGGGLSLEGLTEEINLSLASSNAKLTLADIVGELAELSRIRVSDGTVTSFVSEDSNGLWSTSGL